MRKVKNKVELYLDEVKVERTEGGCSSFVNRGVYTYIFKSHEPIPCIETLECYVEQEEPETLREFRDKYNIDKDDLVSWLNKNYANKPK